MIKVPRVALLIETSNANCRNLLEGIAAYVRDQQPWSFYLGEHERGAMVPGWLRVWDGDGIIARVENEEIASVLAAATMPVGNVPMTQRQGGQGWPRPKSKSSWTCLPEGVELLGYERCGEGHGCEVKFPLPMYCRCDKCRSKEPAK